MADKYHTCGYPIWVPEDRSGREAPLEFFDGRHPEVLLAVCPACDAVLRECDLQDHWDDLEFDLH